MSPERDVSEPNARDASRMYGKKGRGGAADEDPATGRVENATERGRYGSAPGGEPHMTPEVEPARGADAEARPPDRLSGAMPENEGRDADEDAEYPPSRE